MAVVLSSFLVCAGIGSGLVEQRSERVLRIVPLLIAAIALAELPILQLLAHNLLGLPQVAKVAISIAVVAPLALLMGMPFPSGLRRLHDPAAIPWAWGINGTASVLSSMVATLVAVHFGFTAVVAAAALLYVVAAAINPT